MIQIENDKVKLQRVEYAYEYTSQQLREFDCYIAKSNPEGGYDRYRVKSNEFRERFAKSIAELIIAEWDNLVFDERFDSSDSADTLTCSACMYLVRKKEE